MDILNNLSFAALGGILPALFWLWFWLHEDNLHPEPRKRLLSCFLAGMIAVPLVYPFQKVVYNFLGGDSSTTFFLWAAIEEVFKFGAAYIVAISRRDNDEPIDVVIYMITAALGFSALENVFFLFSSLGTGIFLGAAITSNLRFIGANLLHVVSSATVGIFIAIEYYRPTLARYSGFLGLLFAIALHTFFNLSIIGGGGEAVIGFYSVWLGVIIVLLGIEKVKHITNPLL